MPLQDRVECVEGDTITLVCEVNKPGTPAMWLRDDEQIMPGDGYDISVDGLTYTLKIPSATIDHEADYTIMLGNIESTSQVFVEGNN